MCVYTYAQDIVSGKTWSSFVDACGMQIHHSDECWTLLNMRSVQMMCGFVDGVHE